MTHLTQRTQSYAEIAEQTSTANSSVCVSRVTGDLQVFASLHHFNALELQRIRHLFDACAADGARRIRTADDLRLTPLG